MMARLAIWMKECGLHLLRSSDVGPQAMHHAVGIVGPMCRIIFDGATQATMEYQTGIVEEKVRKGDEAFVLVHQVKGGDGARVLALVIAGISYEHAQPVCKTGECHNRIGYVNYIGLNEAWLKARIGLGMTLTLLGMAAASLSDTPVCAYALTVHILKYHRGPAELHPFQHKLISMYEKMGFRSDVHGAHTNREVGMPSTMVAHGLPRTDKLFPPAEKILENLPKVGAVDKISLEAEIDLGAFGRETVQGWQHCNCSAAPVSQDTGRVTRSADVHGCSAQQAAARGAATGAAGDVGGCPARVTRMVSNAFNAPQVTRDPTPPLPANDPVGEKVAQMLEYEHKGVKKNMLFGGTCVAVDWGHKEYLVYFDDGDQVRYDITRGDYPLDAAIKNGKDFDHICERTAKLLGFEHGTAYNNFHGLQSAGGPSAGCPSASVVNRKRRGERCAACCLSRQRCGHNSGCLFNMH